jgi:hypothetical protein
VGNTATFELAKGTYTIGLQYGGNGTGAGTNFILWLKTTDGKTYKNIENTIGVSQARNYTIYVPEKVATYFSIEKADPNASWTVSIKKAAKTASTSFSGVGPSVGSGYFKLVKGTYNIHTVYSGNETTVIKGADNFVTWIEPAFTGGKSVLVENSFNVSRDWTTTITITKTGYYFLNLVNTAATTNWLIEITGKKLEIAKPTKLKLAVGKKKVTASWKKVDAALEISGYEVQYRVKGAKKYSSVKTTSVKKAVKKLKSKKKYQVRVRAYKTFAGKTFYSSWVSGTSAKTK